ncbi:pentatricopeptide repeat-containing protein At3g24000, mitochondrial [Amaranthus tricolor]|uniref:pentatricopeptide repeat-containing protein At3g24000, mitochondrial n=1 Tax=Amaranthus tricolor TaxID=29722 RepID=UPI00258AD3B3|nr:pentatricopeptide repeat-containing protein At3g24000, mitochondrial [Amaranthus tricolor]XP_057527125.1 pentatricopeptide repeat-containing protein At3g24000, mitochondrial [Amaranthus tricolor]XP_057527135.1 pentatricopeptide repeat-containing protein At3g24000, mitochondrial [Amaranthus tricolor]XP_057527145.1 pentatricopeptide repeat-containing protein At3g24000, mitochondrial [Amaranthus tricolor]XP_057527153.1 pentatricopeptide repeat-containing protein At3g24000, mitochondrial [Amaran
MQLHLLLRCHRPRTIASLQSNIFFPVLSLSKRSFNTNANQRQTDFISNDKSCSDTFLWISHHSHPEISQFRVNGFSKITSKLTGKALHCLFLKGMIPLSIFHLNTLISMYMRFGCANSAYHVFDKMALRNEASWNTLIAGVVKAGLYFDAFELFNKMRISNFDLNGFVISSLISACSKWDIMVIQGFQIHGFALKSGLLDDVFVSTSLLHFYGSDRFPLEAKMLFQDMPYKNVVSWTALMVVCSNNGQSQEVIELYRRMKQEGLDFNENTFTIVISSCGILENQNFGLLVLGHVIKSGFESNLSVANSLISMFSNFDDLDAASYVFDLMEVHDTISWNSMITAFGHHKLCAEAFGYFRRMRFVHNEVNSVTLSSLLLACGSIGSVKWGKGIHGLILKYGLQLDVCVFNTLLTMYSGAGELNDAEFLFMSMPEKDLISWNSMITCYALNGMCIDALRTLSGLLRAKKSISQATFASVIAACFNNEFLAAGKVVHGLAVSSGLYNKLIVGNSLITMYANCGLTMNAKQVFDVMPEHDIVTWNALIGGYAVNEEPDQAFGTYQLMRRRGLQENYITIVNLLSSLSSVSSLLKYGKSVHAHVICIGLESNEYVKNSLITMYAKCSDLDSSNVLFNKSKNITPVTYNAIISSNARQGRGEDALHIFTKMYSSGICLDQFTFSSAFAAAANLATLEDGKMLHGLTVKIGFDLNLHVLNAAMDMYGKCGELKDVLKLLPQKVNRSRLSWNILISTYSRHGLFQQARDTFHEMIRAGIQPDFVTFVSLLTACSHGGLIDEGLEYYSSMTRDFGILPRIEHCVCVVDLLGRSGRFYEAEKFLNEMPVPPNGFIWRSLLAACRVHGNVELGKRAAQQLIQMGPDDDSVYVLYSNVCASYGNWEDVESIRNQMRLGHVKKKPAYSWMKSKNKVSSFGMGDQTHPQAKLIAKKLKEIKKLITEAGYVPDTNFSLHNTDEEQKEHNLWNHSERLALAYGLIIYPESAVIRVFKNLRVCGDCHSVYKFVSAVLAREILLKDPYRFHHFKEGKCSCGDFW